MDHLCFDIETVPAQQMNAYSPSIQSKIQEKLDRLEARGAQSSYEYFAATHGDFGKIICISVGFIHGDTIRLKSFFGEDEKKILEDFNALLTKTNRFIHYNGLQFDVPFILQRMAHHRVPLSNPNFASLRRFSSVPHFDVMMQYYNWDMTRVLPLGILAELHGLPSPKEDLSGDQILEAYQQQRWKEIVHYCEFDVATTLNLYRLVTTHQDPIPVENYKFSEAAGL